MSQNNSSPSPNPDTIATEIVNQMGDVIQLVGHMVAQSILTQLSPSASTPLPAPTATSFHAVSSTSAVDAAPVQFVSHRKLKDPPCFRGDGSDLISVTEWEDLMRAFIKLGSLRSEEQAEEILVHLRGKAKDVVQVGIRNSVVDATGDPEAIYGILRRHFDSAQCSPLPLADFYTTLPEKGESAFDYWLRLHRAVDLLNCPSPELAMIFRSKTIDKWTVHEVQEILCESHSEGTLNSSSMTTGRVAMNAQQISAALPAQPTEKHIQPQSTDLATLERLIGMLEKVLLKDPFSLILVVFCPSTVGQLDDPHLKEKGVDHLNDSPICDSDDLGSMYESLFRFATWSVEQRKELLHRLGLQDLDLDNCEVSDRWKDQLLQLVEKYESIFSKDKMDCGEATDVVHKIHLVDERPFRLPYRRVPPSQYEKLRTALNEMEERDIIRKSNSEYASPLVLVWKKDGSLRICTDFRWLNAKTAKDAHPLPHQADALAALSGNVFFSTMDLTSGFYNVPLYKPHKKYTAFSSPFGLHEYNQMPQGLSNSPATFMQMMMSIFGDENFSSLLCYLDDLMVFAPDEVTAL
nr:PREDICTED: uncharacterized protein LOC102210120 [Pundamilia nyererei]